MSGDAGHQQSHPPPAGRVLYAEADGVLPPAVLQPGLPGQGEADPAARPQGGGGLLLPSPGQHVSVSQRSGGFLARTKNLFQLANK